MTWDFEKFLAQYKEGECDNVRCLNRMDALDELRTELLDARMLLAKIMQRARDHLDDNQAAREIYVAIGNHNLGHRDRSAELPREGQAEADDKQAASITPTKRTAA